MSAKTVYYKDIDTIKEPIKVVFFNERGDELVEPFTSKFLSDKFINTLLHSKKSTFVMCIEEKM